MPTWHMGLGLIGNGNKVSFDKLLQLKNITRSTIFLFFIFLGASDYLHNFIIFIKFCVPKLFVKVYDYHPIVSFLLGFSG